jgi:hypothetical protein
MLVTEWIQRKLPLIADPYVKRKSYINKSFAEDATRFIELCEYRKLEKRIIYCITIVKGMFLLILFKEE